MVGIKDKIIWGNVESILKEKQWSLTDLAKAMNVTPQAINSLKKNGIGSRSIKKLSKALNIDEIRLHVVEVPQRKPRQIPVISWVNAGLYNECDDLWLTGLSGEGESVQSRYSVGPNAFALHVNADSMAPRYLPGDIIVVDPSIFCHNGDPCVVVLNGEAVFKLFKETEQTIVLAPMNSRYPEITIKKESDVDFKLIGKVVDLIAKI